MPPMQPGPHGGGYPGGMTPGYPGQPPGPPGPPGPTPPRKKSSTGLWVLLGCGALLVLGAGVSVAGFLYFRWKAQQLADRGPGLVAAALEAAVKQESTPGGKSSTTPPSGGPSGSGACARAMRCCQVIAARTSQNAEVQKSCEAIGALSDAFCQQPLEGYRRAARQLNLTCD